MYNIFISTAYSLLYFFRKPIMIHGSTEAYRAEIYKIQILPICRLVKTLSDVRKSRTERMTSD